MKKDIKIPFDKNTFLYLVASIDDFVGIWLSSGHHSTHGWVLCSKISDIKLNCTFNPEDPENRPAVLIITWDENSTFKMNDVVNMKQGTYDNAKTIVWTRIQGGPTTWIKNSNYIISVFIHITI